MLTADARETLEGNFTDVPEDMRAQISGMLNEMEILSSEYVGDEFHFRLRVPMAPQQEVFVKMRKVEGSCSFMMPSDSDSVDSMSKKRVNTNIVFC